MKKIEETGEKEGRGVNGGRGRETETERTFLWCDLCVL